MQSLRAWKQRAQQLKRETHALYLAYKDPRVPWYAKLFLICLIGYALSPIDLIPDFIPVLGYLDDVLLLPLGVALALKMVPSTVLAECRERGQASGGKGPPSAWPVAALIVAVWLMGAALAIVAAWRAFVGS